MAPDGARRWGHDRSRDLRDNGNRNRRRRRPARRRTGSRLLLRSHRHRLRARGAPHILGLPFIINLPAIVVVLLITVVLVIGIKESANTNNAMVLLKVGIILFFIAVGAFLIHPSNWTSPATGGFAPNGIRGISAA